MHHLNLWQHSRTPLVSMRIYHTRELYDSLKGCKSDFYWMGWFIDSHLTSLWGSQKVLDNGPNLNEAKIMHLFGIWQNSIYVNKNVEYVRHIWLIRLAKCDKRLSCGLLGQSKTPSMVYFLVWILIRFFCDPPILNHISFTHNILMSIAIYPTLW